MTVEVEQMRPAGPVILRWDTDPRDLSQTLLADRDEVLTGVAISAEGPPARQTPYAEGALTEAARAGYAVVLLARLDGFADGTVTLADALAINEAALEVLDPDRVLVDYVIACACTAGRCDCRPPSAVGLRRLEEVAAQKIGRGWIVGDERADLEHGRALGLNTALVATGHGVATWNGLPPTDRHLVDLRTSRFCEAVRHILL